MPPLRAWPLFLKDLELPVTKPYLHSSVQPEIMVSMLSNLDLPMLTNYYNEVAIDPSVTIYYVSAFL